MDDRDKRLAAIEARLTELERAVRTQLAGLQVIDQRMTELSEKLRRALALAEPTPHRRDDLN